MLSTCRASYFSKVLENGTGSAAALAILYIEVCQRLALPMVRLKEPAQHALVAHLTLTIEFIPCTSSREGIINRAIHLSTACSYLNYLLQACRVLEDGHQFVLWPAGQQDRLTVGGQQCVIDPYGKGCLHTAAEVRATDALLLITACLGSGCAAKTRSTPEPRPRCSTDQINI